MPNASVVHCVSLQGSEATASRQNFKQESIAIKDEPNQQPISHYPTHPRAVLSKPSMTVTCAAMRVLTRSRGYVADAAVIPAIPPPIKCTARSAVPFTL